MPVICGTARGSRRICVGAMGWSWVYASANESLAIWDSGCVSPDPKSPSPTRSRSRRVKKLHRLARRKDVELWSVDECHFQQHGTRCRMWVPPEIKDPVLLHAPTRKSVACFGAVSVHTGTFVRSLCTTFTAATFETFLKTLLRHRTHSTRMVLVLDNARYHHAVLLKPVRRTYRAVLILLFLPPSVRSWPPSSESGSWHARLATHNRFFATLNDVLTAVSTCFDRWRKPNPVLRRLCGIS
jgi:transposase